MVVDEGTKGAFPEKRTLARVDLHNAEIGKERVDARGVSEGSGGGGIVLLPVDFVLPHWSAGLAPAGFAGTGVEGEHEKLAAFDGLENDLSGGGHGRGTAQRDLGAPGEPAGVELCRKSGRGGKNARAIRPAKAKPVLRSSLC